MIGYSRIKKPAPNNRSKSLDFAELSLAPSKFNPTPARDHSSIPEHGEAFGVLLARRDDEEEKTRSHPCGDRPPSPTTATRESKEVVGNATGRVM
ncbi:hypothetical protein SASPL_103562 [Salvia splendens]|uniref:Uncharacterized protein n=1 Tax=Salvia splendens TaxID=180675 RepID=A0A8X8YL63_SALSN|nr:hypothetical protein SASPL_103562 [Salvia splendens]